MRKKLMKVLHAYNLHRNGGGSDSAALDVVRQLKNTAGIEIQTFAKNSLDLPAGLSGKLRAATNSIYPCSALGEFRELLRTFKPDILHVHELYPLISPWILAEAKSRGVKIIMTCYDYRLTCPIATHYRGNKLCHSCFEGNESALIRHNCRNNLAESVIYAARHWVARKFALYRDNIDHYITLNAFSAHWLQEKLAIPSNAITTIGCIVEPAATPVDPSQGQYIAYAGRFAPEKGTEILASAMESVDCLLKMAGYEESLPRFTQKNIEVIRTRSRAELEQFYRHAKMLIVPSIWYETFGIVAAEAMAQGVPVIASDIGALAHTVNVGVSGLLFPPRDSKALAEQINKLLANPEQLKALGAGAYRQCQSQYSGEAVSKSLISTYQQLLESA
jgi:glycosyltransferase involved in cell wall biosynthesis